MTWSYTGDPADSDTDAVRWLVQDIDTNNQLVQDEEIDWEVTEQGGVNAAALAVAERIAAQLSITETNFLVTEYQRVLARLRRRLALGVSVYTGGVSEADKDTQTADSDRVRPSFKRGDVYDSDEW